MSLGMPYIDGYKPRFNYQRSLLPSTINEYLKNNPEINELFATDSMSIIVVPTVEDFLAALEEEPPMPDGRPELSVSESQAAYNSTGVNYLEMEARNNSLGEAGEQFVINFERARLIHAGKYQLADRIEQVSATVGSSAGYDIKSFEENGGDRFIEVKTTKYGKNNSFFITKNELQFSLNNSSDIFYTASSNFVKRHACSHCKVI